MEKTSLQPNITLMVDACVFANVGSAVPVILLVRTQKPAFHGRWALPGGKLEPGERLLQAAHRELTEEAGLAQRTELQQLAIYDDPARDERGRVISVAYIGWFTTRPEIRPGSDAVEAQWMQLDAARETPLAFDHATVLLDATRYLGLL